MLKLIIVDDEYITSQWLKMTIDKMRDRFQVIGEARNGQEALRLTQELNPNIILTDIKMPVMNGIELLQAVKKDMPNTKIVIISAYNDFRYAKEALRLGASDFLLKAEINDDDIYGVLVKLEAEFLEANQQKKTFQALQNTMNENIMDIRNAFLKRIVDGIENDSAIIKTKLNNLNIPLEEKNLYVVCCNIDNYYTELNQKKSSEKAVISYRITEIISGVLKSSNIVGCAFEYIENQYIIIMNIHYTSFKTIREKLYLTVSNIYNLIKESELLSLSYGISTFSSRFTELFNQRIEAESALRRKFYSGEGSILFYNELTEKITPNLNPVYQQYIESVEASLKNSDFMHARKSTNELFELLNTFATVESRDICLIIYNISRLYVNKVTYTNGGPKQEFGTNMSLDELEKLDFIDELQYVLNNIIDSTEEWLLNYKPSTYNSTEKAKIYMMNHFNEALTLKKVANHVSLSPSYFCRLFKTEISEKFNEYLVNLRITKAKALLLQCPDMSISEIAQEVGYPNASYFSRLFKKMVGVTTSEFRQNAHYLVKKS